MPNLRTAASSPYFRRANRKKPQDIKGTMATRRTIEPGAAAAFQKLGWDFYDVPALDLARQLLGQIFVRILDNGKRLAATIIETEAYLGSDDKASHSFYRKRTDRNAAMFMRPGTVYVYMTYGMYYCMNISSQGDGSAVLIRSLEPLEGLDDMRLNRGAKRKEGALEVKDRELCNGPAKLCQALKIDKEMGDQKDLVTSHCFWIENGEPIAESAVVKAPRIGIGPSAEEWRDKPMRFYIRNNSFVSVRNKTAEEATQA